KLALLCPILTMASHQGSDRCQPGLPPKSRSCRFGIAPVDMWSAAQRAFGRWHLILGPQVNRHRRPQCPCKPLKTRLRYMMIVDSVKGLDVKCDSGIHGESLKPFIDQLGIKGSNLVVTERHPERKEGSPRYVDGDTGQRLIHRHVHIRITSDAS